MTGRFPSPFTIETPAGAEGWEQLYPYYLVFSADRRSHDESRFWFQDATHCPEALTPWDVTFIEYAVAALSQYNTRHYLVPPARGIDIRILNGYAYLSPMPVTDLAEVKARVPDFLERAGFYFDHWDDLYVKWMAKIRVLIDEMEALRFEPLPLKEDIDVITSGQGTGAGLRLISDYHCLIDLALKLWQYHFEFLNLGYAAYLDYFGFCKQVFPNISDLAIATMVAGVEVDLFRPDEELKGLARAALELGIDAVFATTDDAEAVLAELRGTPAGRQWLERFDAVKDPWFNFSSGSGFYHSDRIWIEHLSIPLGFIGNYVTKLSAGENIDRPVEAIRAERERIATEYSELLGSDEDRAAFEAKLGLARTVFPYVENHNFYVEHWSHSVLWRKMRDIGRMLVREGFFAETDDIFYLKRTEVSDALHDYYINWAVGVDARGPKYWPKEVERRKGIMATLRRWSPPKALGTPPDVVTEPFTIMLWGVTSESLRRWQGDDSIHGGDLTGFAASPGVAEGPARVISSVDQIGEVQAGEILVAPLTAPSWGPIFSRIRATVTDIGGMMSHGAIVCREYGLPAVTGTAFGTCKIKTGQRIRVDGNTGTITILDNQWEASSVRTGRSATMTFAGLLLDIGGPVMRLPFEFLGEIERSYELPPGTITRRGPFDPGTDPLWRDRDAGLLSEREYWRLWAEEVGQALTQHCEVQELFAACYERLGAGIVRGETAALVRDAQAAGIQVGALTNDTSWFFSQELPPTLSVLSEFHPFVDLSHADVRKPDPQAYGTALDALGLAPQQVLFVDDHPRYVPGAEAAGLPAVHFDVTDVAGSIRRIRDRLGLPA